jgi:hypothetical protein
MAITRSDGLRHSPAARDTKSSSRVIAIIIRSLINILLSNIFDLYLSEIEILFQAFSILIENENL